MFDYIIVGAGFAGSVMAERLASQKNKKVLVVEQRMHLGGNCYDYSDETNILVHKYGPHLFHTDNRRVYEYLSKFTEWNLYNHKVKAYVDGKNIPIPFNLNSLRQVFPDNLSSRIETKLLKHFAFNTKVPILELRKVDDEDLEFLADYVYEKIFVNYTAKQWDMKPEEIDPEVTARVPVFIGYDNRYFNDAYQVVPKKGYTKIFNNMLNNSNIKVMLNTSFKDICSIDYNSGKVIFMGQEFSGKVIYTGMIDELFDYKYEELPYRSVNMVFDTVDSEYYQECTTINYPNNYNFTRITEFKHINKSDSRGTTILKEFPVEYVKGKNTPYYPVFTEENKEKYNLYFELSKKFNNIELIGRLAEYKYYDMDDIVERVLEMYGELK